MKKARIVSMPLRDLQALSHGCAWKGCTEHCTFGHHLPAGWRWLALWRGPVGSPPWAEGNVEDRDAVLCPSHARELHNDILKDIGQRLNETAGSA